MMYNNSHVRPCEESSMCSFPSAHVELTKRQQLLMMGQPYRVELVLEMPESPVNKQLGMFMVCVDFRGKSNKLITRSCRSAMLHYRSFVLDLIYTVAYSPLLLIGTVEEKQTINIELFEDYYEIENEAVTDVYVEIQSTRIEIYSAKFLLNAHFSGLRYVMFNWPIISAIIGITSNLFFIAVICMISWYQLIHSEEYKRYVLSQKKLEYLQVDLDDGSSTSSMDDASVLEENLRKRHNIHTIGEDDSL
ncbi:bernardinelli-seip congenital lipodystrophy 2 bscl2 protein [Holotrichia oblita]|uniref:Bernardinelli-seip congenital lipodystrophy 2 bscl2 protein n=3 Tax=Holotrichia oblita TaxID=644536 RepID=A0ACB9TTQ1_HOLOL|nr:bernardinelli-seip congenital lipodystrophy 2 bscl2 protein [Holotrichia oblita]KAI4470020.1 bernardinelli-seip congenital lipodystrophy 2 bscl2 protein [Holotrichia oblita]KAI4470021.1 bernardinelli-seip congenital lipodystrophy 2 bscl2 protein [Holotrichia oblita]